MKAVVLKAFGGAENLERREVADPVPAAGETLLDVRACALNHLDLWIRAGLPGSGVKLPHILGSDVAGLAGGRRVALHPGLCCGACAACKDGRESDCASFGIIGAYGGSPGGYAQKLAVKEAHLLPIPDGISFEGAACLPLTLLTAWRMLKTLGDVRQGGVVVVVGAGSGVAVMGIQIAKALGASVIATTTDPAKADRAKALGADHVLVAPPADLAREVRKLTAGAMADVAFEHVGPALFMDALKCLKPSGRLVTCGSTSGPKVELDMRYVFSRQLRILGSRMGSLREMKEAWALVEAGTVKPVVDKVFPLADAAAAHARLESRAQFGKVVLAP
ncbi:MAG: zinc-binding dehydrogenase [Elusimicrobiota bacterium]|nr:MAG: zinc-binding dehydrogenase [Elusimicrobiota bacterium]